MIIGNRSRNKGSYLSSKFPLVYMVRILEPCQLSFSWNKTILKNLSSLVRGGLFILTLKQNMFSVFIQIPIKYAFCRTPAETITELSQQRDKSNEFIEHFHE